MTDGRRSAFADGHRDGALIRIARAVFAGEGLLRTWRNSLAAV